MKVLITGGAGFIGSYLTQELKAYQNEIAILDNFHPQIHGEVPVLDAPWLRDVDLHRGSVEDIDVLRKAAADCDAIVHLAAETGTGQSMEEVRRYSSVNLTGTTNLAHLIATKALPNLKKVVVASSRAIYGEGKYICKTHGVVYPEPRTKARMNEGLFEPICPICGIEVSAVANDETTHKAPASFYGLSKQFQEECLLLMSKAVGVSCIALRFQNVYGPRQSLKNPYTGVLTVFAKCAYRGSSINVFEDGRETRDFVYVEDVVQSIRLALERSHSLWESFNVGTGMPTAMLQIAETINAEFGSKSDIHISGDFRLGDIRHNFADISKIETKLGYQARVSIEDGVRNFCEWAKSELRQKI